jgi:chemotaxis family two-component system response regulator Rcp1
VKAEDASLKTIPAVILTTSEVEADMVKSYQLQANCYLSKTAPLDAFESLVKSCNDFWLPRSSCRSRGKANEQEINQNTSPGRR